ncbi:SMP-30/gluconolactonase/LRE family protein [Sphingomonas aracearum]|nr:SMP-30/gluconolactonase/LRE family protein [Sphingomonas aracearum]
MTDVRTVWSGKALLGEGPCWDAGRGVLWFVDIKNRRVHRLDPASGEARSWDAPAQVGWVLPAQDGGLVAGLQTGLARFDPETGAFTPLADPEPHLPGNRLNDATVAPDGSIWFGTMHDSEEAESGRVYRFDGRDIADSGIAPVTITNGPALSPDGTILYHVDTIAGVIHAVPVEGGQAGEPRAFARIAPQDGNPDGVSTDSAGNVWVGLWGGGCARLYAPDGSLLREVKLPAANITKVALGGADFRTAYATSASIGLPEGEDAGEAGNVFTFQVEVPGRPLPLAKLA